MAAKRRRSLVQAAKDSADTPAELEAAVRRKRAEPAPEPEPEQSVARTKITVHLPADLAHELRVAVSELPPKVMQGGISGFVAKAVETAVLELRAEHNQGEPFKADETPTLKPGRYPKA